MVLDDTQDGAVPEEKPVDLPAAREKAQREAFEPARELLLVESIEGTGREEKSKGGIWLPHQGTNWAQYRVIAVGPTFAQKSGLSLKKGDIVLGHKLTGHALFGAILMSVNDIYGVVARAS